MKLTRKIKLLLVILSFLLVDIFLLQSQVNADDSADDIQEKIDKYEDKAADVQQDIEQSQTQLQKTEVQMGTTKSLINKTETEISKKEKEINDLNQKIELNKKLLEEYILEMYYSDQNLAPEFILSKEELDKLSSNFDQLINVKDKISSIIEDINSTKDTLGKTREELSDKKEDHEKLLSIQQSEQYEIKSDIKEAQATLSELNAKINKLKGELSKLLGTSVSYDNILDAAAFASKKTGVRKDYLLGVLVVESNLGRYTGGCNFKESKMSGTRAEIFKDICKELDYDYKKQKVSCPPSGYKGTGGAMGVAQFMPDTWAAYKSSIASTTGHKPPDPWSLTDGVTAMALKLSKVSGVTAHKESAEAKAYCVYLAGNNWASYCDNKGTNYGQLVLYWADNYEKKLQ